MTQAPSDRDVRLGIYLHVPFCAVRCGYCDFNTYTAAELGRGGAQAEYAGVAVAEIALASAALQRGGRLQPAATVFFGGGTPTLLPVADLSAMLRAVRTHIGLAPDVEVTTEANPDSVDAASLQALADSGFTRVSFGMQSAVPQVLATLDRTHDPQRVPQVVGWARQAGLEVSLDLIYGTPGESIQDWRASLEAVLACGVEHVSAYALTVEPGTALWRKVSRAELPGTDEDDLAAKYELADEVLGEVGLAWYEVSNWARLQPGGVETRCRHNLGYWRGDDWWGIGPGAHSHVAGRRWWNLKHPGAYAQRLAADASPEEGHEVLTEDQRYTERVLLGVRLAEGLPIDDLNEPGRRAVAGLVADGLVDGGAAVRDHRLVLTVRGRLLADAVVRALLPRSTISG